MSGHQRAGAIDIDINGDTGIKEMTSAQRKIMMDIAHSRQVKDVIVDNR